MSSSSASNAKFDSSSRKNIFLRGASPAAIATATAGFAGNDPAKVVEFTQHAIASASSMDALIGTISTGYRGIIAPVLRNALDIAGKLNTARRTLAGYVEHRTLGRWPPFISGMHNPFASIQPAKEARSVLSALLSDANSWFKKQKEEALGKVIDLKEAEIDHLDKLCSPSALEDQIVKTLDTDWDATLRSLGLVVGGGKMPEQTGTVGKTIPAILRADLNVAKGLAPFWAAKVWDFTRVKSQKSLSLLEQKKDLVAKASEEMDVDSPSVEQMVKDAVQTAMEGLSLQSTGRGQAKGKQPAQKKRSAPPLRKKPAPRTKVTKPSGSATTTTKKRPRVASGVSSGPKRKQGKKN
ncbi:hypothetical protein HOY80DRAFT_1067326 [Tuber brumale]|nr:hypothetical protein HOY80DRAFT_1067326 [Tuber brumale]